MRIQETDRILRDSRYARNAVAQQHQEEGLMTRAWKVVSALPERMTSLFRRH